nr:twin-arginine translocase TatA/TatE family subunit [Paracoccus saliphilus]
MLNNIGLPGLLLIAVVALVLFGKGKVSSLMGEMGKGISAFKSGLKDGEAEAAATSGQSASPAVLAKADLSTPAGPSSPVS